MLNFNIQNTRNLLQNFEFKTLFIEELGWSNPATQRVQHLSVNDSSFDIRHIAYLGGAVVVEVTSDNGEIPDAKTRAATHKEFSKLHFENLLIFVNKGRTQSLWYWVKREEKRNIPRDHIYVKGQPGDLFLSKLVAMVVDIGAFEQGEPSIVEAVERLKKALDIETTTKKFYAEYDDLRVQFSELIEGIDDERKCKWYASVLLNRLMFIYFLQKKFFLDNGDDRYLQRKLEESKKRGKERFYPEFLKALFFEGFAKPKVDEETRKLIGNIKYLNGGLFIEHSIERDYKGKIHVPDKAFDNLFKLFERYSWHLDDRPGENDNEISPDVLGYIFEKYINQKEFGAYYTRPEITEYLCDRTISKLIVEKVNAQRIVGIKKEFSTLSEMLLELNAPLCKFLLLEVLPELSLLDPACGSGAFLVAAMKSLINIYSAIIGRLEFLNDHFLDNWLKKIKHDHPSIAYFIKKRIITDNLFGVDIMEEAAEIAKLRLFLALVAAARSVDELEPLPNVDFNIMTGNSLIGLMHISDKEFDQRQRQGNLFQKSYREILAEKNRLIDGYRHDGNLGVEDLRSRRDTIEMKKNESIATLNEILLDEFGKTLGIKYEEATWDEKKQKEGKPKKRALAIADIQALHPFHWGYEFDEILIKKGGFDAIITNPPWQVFKPESKEFFAEYSTLVTKNKMNLKDFEKEKKSILKQKDIREAWLNYQSRFPHVSEFFRSAPQYKNQISIVDGKKAVANNNLYKIFTEQCFNLLRSGGECGIIIPSGIYMDLGAKQLREMLFGETQLTGLFCFENRKGIFENVDSRFKFTVLTFEKGSMSRSFPAAFMRHDVEELARFPNENSIRIDVELVRKLAPGSLVVTEFKEEIAKRIFERLYRFPTIGKWLDGYPVEFSREFNASDDDFRLNRKEDGFPIYEGKMIEQFDSYFDKPSRWISKTELKKTHFLDRGDWQHYRFAIRRVASITNQRSLIASVLPKECLTVHSLFVNVNNVLSGINTLYLVAFFNSFVLDFVIRNQATANVTQFLIHQLPVPRLSVGDKYFAEIVERGAKLICTTPEFDDLANEVGLGSHKNGVKDDKKRAKLRAELDGVIAHLYSLTEEEFAYVLTTFPIIPQSVKDAALEAYREFAPKADEQEIEALIKAGENAKVEFKSSLRWDVKENRVNKTLEQVVVKAIAGFLNAEGGTLLIGVEDNQNIIGLAPDYKTLGKHQNKDGFENHVTTLLLDAYGKDSSPHINATFHTLDGKEICKIMVAPSPKPVYAKDEKGEHLYIRTGNSTRELNAREAVEYCKIRWK